jgi:hypothetical protein
VLKRQPFSRLSPALDKASRTIKAITRGLDRVDVLFDGHPGATQIVNGTAPVTFTYPAGTAVIDMAGFAGDVLRQRRRLVVRSMPN